MCPDISMCSGVGCPVKKKCYRYTANPTPHWQAYFTRPPITKDGCEYFWGKTDKDTFKKQGNNLKKTTKFKDIA